MVSYMTYVPLQITYTSIVIELGGMGFRVRRSIVNWGGDPSPPRYALTLHNRLVPWTKKSTVFD